MQRNATLLAVVSACFSMGLASQARAAAFALHEQGASGLGNAYAGAAAVAEDATTVWWNPAGMARLGAGKHFALGRAYIVPSTNFNNGASQDRGRAIGRADQVSDLVLHAIGECTAVTHDKRRPPSVRSQDVR